MPRIAILFWCYKDAEVCADRLRLIRHHNPRSQIFVLYGGPPDNAQGMQDALEEFADDFWVFDENRDALWKWKHGDRLIARWHAVRGKTLDGWDHLFVAQWDMLMAVSVDALLEGLPERAAIFSGRLTLGEVQAWWPWVRGRANRVQLALFRLRLALIERYFGPVFNAPFIIVCAPRRYFDKLSTTLFPTLGFSEYRCPTFAVAWGFDAWDVPALQTWRPSNPATEEMDVKGRFISASTTPVPSDLLQAELHDARGARIFHPVHADDKTLGVQDVLYAAGGGRLRGEGV